MSRVIRASALKRLKDTYKSDDLILPHLQRHVMRDPQLNARPEDHSAQYMHPSDMVKSDWCGRRDFYRMTGVVPNYALANPSFRMENVLAEGHTIHEKYQGWFRELGVLWGMWKCLECGHIFGARSPVECQFCKSKALVYRELPLHHERFMVEGHADSALHADWYRGLVEIKSIGVGTLRFEAPRLYNRYMDGTERLEDIWMKINRPFGTHIRQGQLYLWMSWPVYEQIAFVYESKWSQTVKEFIVQYDKRLIAPILETAREVSHAVRAGIPPARPLWAHDAEAKFCKSCIYRRTCWSLPDEQPSKSDTKVRVERVRSAKRKRVLRRAA